MNYQGMMERLLASPKEWAEKLLDVPLDDAIAIAKVLSNLFAPESLLAGIRAMIDSGAACRASFLYTATKGKHPIVELALMLPCTHSAALMREVGLSDSLYIPYDLRACACERLSDQANYDCHTAEALQRCAAEPSGGSYKNLLEVASNGIDHDFEIPEERSERSRILLAGARAAMRRDRSRLARRALGQPNDHPPLAAPFASDDIYLPQHVHDVFSTFAGPGLRWYDFVVEWNEILVTEGSEQYTAAELLRLLLLDSEYHLPGRVQRGLADAVHLNLLRTFSGATLGLRAGVLFVEHGFRPEASYLILGEGVIVGKGCIIDGTGVTVVERNAFLGGGLSPILIHTHKHIEGGGSAERKKVMPVGFRARQASRLPMTFVGLLEVADLEMGGESGLQRIPIVSLPRAAVWGPLCSENQIPERQLLPSIMVGNGSEAVLAGARS